LCFPCLRNIVDSSRREARDGISLDQSNQPGAAMTRGLQEAKSFMHQALVNEPPAGYCHYGTIEGGQLMEAGGSGYPVRLDLEAPLTVARWRPLVNWILAIPQFIIAAGLQYLRRALLIVSFFMVLFTEQIPEQLFNLIVMTDRYEWRVKSFAFWMRDSYPPFNFNMVSEDDGIDPASVSIAYPTKLNRWMPLVKWFLAIPHYFVLLFVYIAAVFVVIVAFFAVLFTGKYPARMRDFIVGSTRWSMRVRAYVGFLRDEYPPFSLS
jgi:hypothetical protein